jgi:phosphoenolpyruvate-protein kinase (PTS system EI component)
VDRDSEALATAVFDEQDAAVLWMIRSVIARAHESGVKVGLCGQAPSTHPEFARFLVECGIDSVSVTPDSFVAVKRQVALAEAGAAGGPRRESPAVSRLLAEDEVSHAVPGTHHFQAHGHIRGRRSRGSASSQRS